MADRVERDKELHDALFPPASALNVSEEDEKPIKFK